MLGYSFDWDRRSTISPTPATSGTQWDLPPAVEEGLAYKTTMPVNWCTSCKCVLANEEVVEGV